MSISFFVTPFNYSPGYSAKQIGRISGQFSIRRNPKYYYFSGGGAAPATGSRRRSGPAAANAEADTSDDDIYIVMTSSTSSSFRQHCSNYQKQYISELIRVSS